MEKIKHFTASITLWHRPCYKNFLHCKFPWFLFPQIQYQSYYNLIRPTMDATSTTSFSPPRALQFFISLSFLLSLSAVVFEIDFFIIMHVVLLCCAILEPLCVSHLFHREQHSSVVSLLRVRTDRNKSTLLSFYFKFSIIIRCFHSFTMIERVFVILLAVYCVTCRVVFPNVPDVINRNSLIPDECELNHQ